jgi:hypothetical protein
MILFILGIKMAILVNTPDDPMTINWRAHAIMAQHGTYEWSYDVPYFRPMKPYWVIRADEDVIPPANRPPVTPGNDHGNRPVVPPGIRNYATP